MSLSSEPPWLEYTGEPREKYCSHSPQWTNCGCGGVTVVEWNELVRVVRVLLRERDEALRDALARHQQRHGAAEAGRGITLKGD